MAQWWSASDSGSRGCGFESYWRHCVVSLSKALFSLLFTGSTLVRKTRPDMTEKMVTGA